MMWSREQGQTEKDIEVKIKKWLKKQVGKAGDAWARQKKKWQVAGVLAFVVLAVFLMIWPPMWAAEKVTAPRDKVQMANETRRTWAQILGGVVLLFGVYLTYRRVSATERRAEAAQKTVEVAERGQITERFTRAIDQLGSGKLEVRLGGIYALAGCGKTLFRTF